MAWKKPDLDAPIVTFTPPPEEPVASSSFEYKPSVLTRKRLERFNVRNQNNDARVPRTSFADGDDGFESLNGNNSNGSDGENRANLNQVENIVDPNPNQDNVDNSVLNDNEESKISAKIVKKNDSVDMSEKDKSNDVDSDGPTAMSSPSKAKRAGVRFRNSWVQDMFETELSEEVPFKKKKKKVNGKKIISVVCIIESFIRSLMFVEIRRLRVVYL